jgi:hypothetical protein
MSNPPQVRIYADFNGLVRGVVNPTRTAVVLDTFGSVRDLSNAGVVLSPGLPLIAYDESDESEDLEGHGTAQYDPKRRWWVVEFDEVGVRDVPRVGQVPEAAFHCVRCRLPVAGVAYNTLGAPGLCCKNCGTSVMAAISPPA